MDDDIARDAIARVETLLEQVEGLDDPAARAGATELAAVLLDLYGEGLARLVGHVAGCDADGTIAAAVAEDELLSHLLLLHGLHPVPLEERVRSALEEVRPYLDSHGGDVVLLGVEDGVARLQMQGSCSGCPSSAMTLKLAVERAIHKAAPDVERVEAVDAGATAPPPGALPVVMAAGPGPAGGAAAPPLLQIDLSPPPAPGPAEADAGGWIAAGGVRELDDGAPLLRRVAGEDVLFLRLEGRSYAYRPRCPGCEASLGGARMRGPDLVCACGHRYDVGRAGRCLDTPELHLDPVPLLVDDAGLVRVALGTAA